MSLLELKEVTVSFAFPDGRPALLALNQVNLSVAQGELVALVGPSGCGKTTALNVLAGQVVPTSGQVRLAGEPVQGILPSVGYISQADTLLPWRTVLDNVALAMELRGVPKSQRQETARALMKNMGLEGFEQSYPRELSGGMKKAGRHRPGAGSGPRHSHDGRALCPFGRFHPAAPAGRYSLPLGEYGLYHPVCHPRPYRGHHPGRPGGPHERPARARGAEYPIDLPVPGG